MHRSHEYHKEAGKPRTQKRAARHSDARKVADHKIKNDVLKAQSWKDREADLKNVVREQDREQSEERKITTKAGYASTRSTQRT